MNALTVWQLRVLGPATLDGPGVPGLRLERKMAACLAYLALEGATYRSRLVGLLWPESPEATARNNLSQLLRKLRLTTGTDLLGSGDPLVLPPQVEVDALRLRDLYAQGRYADLRAVPGELLAGLTYDDCPELDDWVTAERERLRDWRGNALREDSTRLEHAGDHAEALERARELLDLDPVSEDAWRRVMRLLYLRGDRPAALRAYQKCTEVLKREFGSEPLPETVALAREIDRGAVPASAPAGGRRDLPLAVLRPPTLVGREREWALMEDAWAAGQWIYLRGDPGSGKTRLALDFVASKGDSVTLGGRPGDTAVPFASTARNARMALARWPDMPIQPWVRREMSRLVPELRHADDAVPVTGGDDVLRLRQAMQVFFIERLGQVPGLVLDDWQYYDDTSNQDGVYMWFTPPPQGVAGRMPRPVVTYRRGEVAPESEARILELVSQGMAVIIDIEPLSGPGLNALMDDIGVPGDPEGRARLTRYTGGNPLFLLETVKDLLETDQLAAGLPQALPLPEKVWQLIERRLARLSPQALQVARAAATLQRDFDVPLIAEVLGAPLLDVAAAWEELSAAQLVRGDAFWHDLIFEAVRGDMPSTLSPLLHRGAARALERAGGDPARTAQHWLEAGAGAEAIPALLAAEHHARASFQPEAADHYRARRENLQRGVGAPAAAPETVDAPPAWALPATSGGFYGRDPDLQHLVDALRGRTPVLTLIGPGGVGKTRLAIETGRVVAGDFPDGVAFVPLAGVTDPAQLLSQVARVLGVTDTGGGLDNALRGHVQGRRLLLVLDNFEQLLAGAQAVATLAGNAPGLRVLVTSRAPLRITGERVIPVFPLPLPDARSADDNAAVTLFVQRARTLRPDFALTPDNHAAVAQIVQRLDGLPLALELAAARLRVLPPAALLARLDRALPLLSQGARDLPERQQALRATIAWSDDLLPPAERELYRRLSVFQGGWTLEAAEAVMDAPDQLDVLEALSTLIDHSLVRVQEVPGGEPRYDMLSTIREYALEQLTQGGQEHAARERHAAFVLDFARRAQAGLATPQQARWAHEFGHEALNIRTALTWLLERGRLDAAAELGWRVAVYAWVSGGMVEAQAAMTALLAHPHAAALGPLASAHTHGTLGIMRLWLYERQGARDALERALADFRAAGDAPGIVLSTIFLSLALTQLGETEHAGALALANVEAARPVDPFVLALAYSANGFQAMAQRDVAGIVEWYSQVVALATPRGDHLNALHGHAVLAIAAIMGGQFPQAASGLEQADRHARAIGYVNGTAMVLEAYTLLHLNLGDLEAGALLYGASQALREQISTPNWDEGPLPPAQTEAMLGGALGTGEFDRLRAQGRAMEATAAIEWARRALNLQPA